MLSNKNIFFAFKIWIINSKNTIMKRLLLYLFFIISLPFTSIPVQSQDKVLTKGKGSFMFSEYEPLKNKPIRIWYYNPSDDPSELPVLFVMHGVNRNADDYRDNWVELAEKYQVIVIVPEFSKEHFPGAENYNLGGMFDEGGEAVAEEKWSYSLIEPIFDQVKKITKTKV